MRIFALILIFNILSSVSLVSCVDAKEKDFRQLRSSHFLINYRKDVDEGYIFKIRDIAEKFYKVITQEFNLVRDKLWIWENRAVLYIAKDKADYSKSFKCFSWSAACVDYNRKIIYTYQNHVNFETILVHELTHIIFREYVKGGNLPLWLEEGVAVYMENKYGRGSYGGTLGFLKKKIEDDSYIKLVQLNNLTTQVLTKSSKEYVNLFYIESFSLINFLMEEHGSYRFYRFLYYLRKGHNTEKALARAFYYYKNLDIVEREWKKFYQE